jgi:transposase-like protein
MVAAVGVTITGDKVLLGFVQTATENRKVCAAFLRELVERGLRVDLGLLVVTDGSKGLHAAVRDVFDSAALLQRCQWHYADLRIMPTSLADAGQEAGLVSLMSA